MRELDLINAEYSKTAMLAGEKQYIIKTHQDELEEYNKQLKALNFEARDAIAAKKKPEVTENTTLTDSTGLVYEPCPVVQDAVDCGQVLSGAQ